MRLSFGAQALVTLVFGCTVNRACRCKQLESPKAVKRNSCRLVEQPLRHVWDNKMCMGGRVACRPSGARRRCPANESMLAGTRMGLCSQHQARHPVKAVRCGPCAERELVLLKIRAPPGPTRTEVMQLIDIFRARVVDVSDRSLTIAVTGDSGKVPLCSNRLVHSRHVFGRDGDVHAGQP